MARLRNDRQTNNVASAEWRYLLECARPAPDFLALKTQLRKPLDCSDVYGLAADHAILGLLAHSFDRCEIEPPPAIAESLRSWRRNYALFTLKLTAEMFRLFDCFRDAGVEAFVTKGPALSVRCYGDPSLRQYGDLDLIIRDRDIARVTELMTRLGYEATIPLSAIQAKKIPGEYNFRLKSSQLLVEFHTERTFRYHPRPLPLERLFQRQARLEFDGHSVPTLSPEDELVLICIHGAKHFWERLGYIADVAAFVSRQTLDWQKVESAAAEVSAQRMLYVGLRLAQDLLGAPIPQEIQARVHSDSVAQNLAAKIGLWLPAAGFAEPGIFERALFRIRMHGHALGGLTYLLRLSFSPTEQDWSADNPAQRPRVLDAIGRPFRLARKYGSHSKD